MLLACALITIGSCIWQATATSYSSFLGARILTGLGAAANESIMPVVVADVKFLHQRGRYLGLYLWVPPVPVNGPIPLNKNQIKLALLSSKRDK